VNGWWPTLLLVLAAMNPPVVAALAADRTQAQRSGAALLVVAGALLLLGTTDSILEALGITIGTYRLGAGVVVLVAAIVALVRGAPEPSEGGALGAYARPGLLAVAVALGTGNWWRPAVAVLLVVPLCEVCRHASPAGRSALARLGGGLGVVLAVALAVDGVKTL
jgi:small neutral amino acid transporter SnatA (MarC family)